MANYGLKTENTEHIAGMQVVDSDSEGGDTIGMTSQKV